MECGVWSAAPATQNDTGHVQSAALATKTVTRLVNRTQKYCACHTRRPSTRVGMSQSATPSTQNDMTTCLKTFEKERFCSFPHRHGEATGKPETRDETRGRAFRARLPPIFRLCSFKIDVFLRVLLGTSKFATSKSINFHHISQNATPATESAPCRHLTQP